MNEIVVNSKKNLLKTTEDLVKTTEQYRNRIESESAVLKSITNYGVDLKSAAKILVNNFDAIFTDCYNVTKTANNYINNLINLDIDDFNLSNNVLLDSSKELYTSYTGPSSSSGHTGSSSSSSSSSSTGSSNSNNNSSSPSYPTTGPVVDENVIQTAEGTEIYLPSGLGSVRTYMGWQCITNKSSTQYKLMQTAGVNFDEEGFGRIGDRYVVATTTTFGKVGDFIDVYQEDGTVLKCIIGDIKSQNDPGCNKWGHNNGKCVVESIVDKNTWYKNGAGNHANPGTASCHPEWKQNIVKIVNKGNYFDYIKNNNTKDIVNV